MSPERESYEKKQEVTLDPVVEVPKKSFLWSKTTWLGFATFILGMAEYMHQSELLESYPEIVAIIGLAIILLRAVTKTGITLGVSKPPKILILLVSTGLIVSLLGSSLTSISFADDYMLLRRGSQSKLYRVDSQLRTYELSVQIVDMGSITPDDPTIPSDPNDLTEVARLAYDEAVKVNRPTESAVIAATYATISQQVMNGTLSVEDAGKDASTVVDLYLSTIGSKERWDGWRRTLAAHLRTKGLRTKEEFADAYQQLADGLNAAAGNQQNAFDISAIFKLVLAVISKNPAAIAVAIGELLESLRDSRGL